MARNVEAEQLDGFHRRFPIGCNEWVPLQGAQWRRTSVREGVGRLWSRHHIFFLWRHRYLSQYVLT